MLLLLLLLQMLLLLLTPEAEQAHVLQRVQRVTQHVVPAARQQQLR
jgi:hypothetical protein